MSYVRIALAAGALAVAFGGGWTVNGWRLGERARAVDAAHAQERADSWREVARETARLSALAAGLQADLVTIAAQGRADVKKANDETDRLQLCIARGTCGLRVRVAVPTACPDPTAPRAEGGPVGEGTSAALAADARPAYFALRSGIALTEGKLAACQKSLGAFEAWAATQGSPGP